MAYTSSSQNTRVFAPYVFLSQDTSRIFIKVQTGQGYSIQSGITAGDVVRFDPTSVSAGITGMYKKSQADSEMNAEVVGVVESISGGQYTIVTHGSISYPAARLAGLCGSAGGLDILFLDAATSGNLVGNIDTSTPGEKIVKPVFQVAPHGSYNGIVTNYIGYKTGGSASVSIVAAGAGNIQLLPSTVAADSNWLDISSDRLEEKSLYPELFLIYSTTAGPYVEKISIASPPSGWVGKQIFQLNGTVRINQGTVISVNLSDGYILVQKASFEPSMSIGPTIFISILGTTQTVTATATEINKFTIPAVTVPTGFSQSGFSLVPYIQTTSGASTFVPDSLTVESLTVTGNLSVGTTTNLQTTLTSLQAQITQIFGILS
jgi:hypothetical protein